MQPSVPALRSGVSQARPEDVRRLRAPDVGEPGADGLAVRTGANQVARAAGAARAGGPVGGGRLPRKRRRSAALMRKGGRASALEQRVRLLRRRKSQRPLLSERRSARRRAGCGLGVGWRGRRARL